MISSFSSHSMAQRHPMMTLEGSSGSGGSHVRLSRRLHVVCRMAELCLLFSLSWPHVRHSCAKLCMDGSLVQVFSMLQLTLSSCSSIPIRWHANSDGSHSPPLALSPAVSDCTIHVQMVHALLYCPWVHAPCMVVT